MPIPVPEVDNFDPTVDVPVDADVANAASVQLPFGELADRTRYLFNRRRDDRLIDSLRNWFDRTAALTAHASPGIVRLRRGTYNPAGVPDPQMLVIGQAGGGNVPPAMASVTGDGWIDTSAGMVGTNRSDFDCIYSAELGLWLIIGQSGVGSIGYPGVSASIHTHPTDLTAGVWTPQTPATVHILYAMFSSALQFAWPANVVVFGAAGAINTSVDGSTWVNRVPFTASDLSCCAVSTGAPFATPFFVNYDIGVAAGVGGVIGSTPLYPEAFVGQFGTWHARVSGVANDIRGLAWHAAAKLFIGVTSIGEVITSPDGSTWTVQAPLFSPNLINISSVSYNSDFGIAIAISNTSPGTGALAGTEVWWTLDGITWQGPIKMFTWDASGTDHAVWCKEFGWIAVGVSVSSYKVMQSLRRF